MDVELDISPEFEIEIDIVPETNFDLDLGAEQAIVLTVDTAEPGPQGPTGPQGPQGIPGNSFGVTAWWSGTGPPGTVVGAKVGDYYVDTLNGIIYKLGE